MGGASSIEWTQATWNPLTGCNKVSPGCKHCYAERMAKRLHAMDNPRYENGFKLTLHHDLVDLPMRWKQPKVIFVNSMSDLFHKDVPDDFVQAVFATMEKANQHIFQVLTKRADRLVKIAPKLPWPDNVWMGVSVERQDYVWRVDELRRVPAKVRFLSCEPLLGPLQLNLRNIHWAIVGGESGPGARPMKLEWARGIREQCRRDHVAYFLKQLGGAIDKRGHEKAELDGQLWREMPRASKKLDPVFSF